MDDIDELVRDENVEELARQVRSLRGRLEATETLVRQYDGQAEKHLAEIASLAAEEEKPDGWILSDGHRAGHG
jgi:hypothetical protein